MTSTSEMELGALISSDTSEEEAQPARGGRAGSTLLVFGAVGAVLVLTLVCASSFNARRAQMSSGAPAAVISEEVLQPAVVVPNPYANPPPAPLPTSMPVEGPVATPAPLPVVAPVPAVAPGLVPTVATLANPAVAPAVSTPAVAPAVSTVPGEAPCSSGVGDARENPLKRTEALADKNVCRDDEEIFGGLCYRKCALFPGFDCKAKRISAFQCCNGAIEDCKDPLAVMNFMSEIESLVPCTGYDVSSADGTSGQGFSCPHTPGACLKNEEQDLGMCYKQCKILTEGTRPYRCGPASCGSVDPATKMIACVTNSKTSGAFYVGGGAGDNDPSTPAKPHLPQRDETEESTPTDEQSASK